MSTTRVRFAPSPTGELHIGGARTALFNFLFARNRGGAFILRVDDTDLERSREDFCEKLYSALRWLGLDWDEGPYRQSEHLELYRSKSRRLIEEGRAYYCYCSIEELAAGREEARRANRPYLYPGTCREKGERGGKEGEAVVRLRIPEEGSTVVHDLVRGEVSFAHEDLDDFIIMKSNGLPTYNFASIVDDLEMAITEVIRAEEHLPNTPRQQLCAEALGCRLPLFAHVPMILAADRSKLSKRHGATSVEEFREQGHLPQGLLNYMALLGWSPGGDEEILSLERLVETFSLDKVGKTAAVYDVEKLAWINSHYLRFEEGEKLAELARPFFREAGLLEGSNDPQADAYLEKVVVLARERSRTLRELARRSAYFYQDPQQYDPGGAEKHFMKKPGETALLLQRMAGVLEELTPFNEAAAEEAYRALAGELNLGLGRLIHPTRLALTGETVGPGLFEILALLGRETAVRRLREAALFCKGADSKLPNLPDGK